MNRAADAAVAPRPLRFPPPAPTAGTTVGTRAIGHLEQHLELLRRAIGGLEAELHRIDSWGGQLATRLSWGSRLLTVGNGGSAAHAAHLASELVGRYAEDREPFSALALHVDGSTLTALANDYGVEAMFARQAKAHLRPGDVLIAFSTSGRSPNVVAAIDAARAVGATTWSMTGPGDSPVASGSDDVLAVGATRTATVQEVHQVAIHLLCASFDHHLLSGPAD